MLLLDFDSLGSKGGRGWYGLIPSLVFLSLRSSLCPLVDFTSTMEVLSLLLSLAIESPLPGASQEWWRGPSSPSSVILFSCLSPAVVRWMKRSHFQVAQDLFRHTAEFVLLTWPSNDHFTVWYTFWYQPRQRVTASNTQSVETTNIFDFKQLKARAVAKKDKAHELTQLLLVSTTLMLNEKSR